MSGTRTAVVEWVASQNTKLVDIKTSGSETDSAKNWCGLPTA
ncbi:MAG TPA: hypothetical protein VGN93_04490 [Shinella sp.]|nr:hypothetical protein [Shinella sp.]